MGSTGVFLPPSVKTREQFFHAELEHDLLVGDIIDHAVNGTTIYIAFRTPEGEINAAVVPTFKRRADGGYTEWIYKGMTEREGPCEDKCPLRILRLLTNPAPNQWAEEWRERCYAHFKKR